MANIKPVYGEKARRGLYMGITMLNDAVKVTLGPMGRNVLMRKMHHGIHPTKDGVTVAERMGFEDELHNMGAQLVKQTSQATNDDAGDGTTTSTLLAWAMIDKGLLCLKSDSKLNPVQIKRGMERAVKDVVLRLKEQATPINDDMKKIRDVAIISSNNDKEMGNIIGDAFDKIGLNGTIKVQESHSNDTYIDIVAGTQFNSGYASPYFVTDTDTMQVIYDQGCDVIITEEKLNDKSYIQSIEMEITRDNNRPLLIITNDYTEEVLAYLVMGKVKVHKKIFLVKSPYFGVKREAYLDDLSVLIGTTVFSKELSMKHASLSQLGSVDKCIVTDNVTLLINGHGKPEDIDAWIRQLKSVKAESPKEKEDIEERISRLTAGVAVLNVGAASEAEAKEKRDRVDDALSATKAAMEEGVIEGGGVAFQRIYHSFNYHEMLLDYDESFITGYNIVMDAILEPFQQIMRNAGYTKEQIEYYEHGFRDGSIAGFNVATGEECNMEEEGIIDPMKVARVALENAVSVAGVVITTECVLVDTSLQKREDEMPAFLQD